MQGPGDRKQRSEDRRSLEVHVQFLRTRGGSSSKAMKETVQNPQSASKVQIVEISSALQDRGIGNPLNLKLSAITSARVQPAMIHAALVRFVARLNHFTRKYGATRHTAAQIAQMTRINGASISIANLVSRGAGGGKSAAAPIFAGRIVFRSRRGIRRTSRPATRRGCRGTTERFLPTRARRKPADSSRARESLSRG